jgi:hypothetical protein
MIQRGQTETTNTSTLRIWWRLNRRQSLEIESKKHHALPDWMSTSCLDIIHGPSWAWVCLSPELLEALTAVVSPTTVISRHERDLQRFAQGYKDGAWSHTPVRLSFLCAWWESTSPGFGGPGSGSRFVLFAYAEIWLMLMLMLKYYERKILFRGWKVVLNKPKRTWRFSLDVELSFERERGKWCARK